MKLLIHCIRFVAKEEFISAKHDMMCVCGQLDKEANTNCVPEVPIVKSAYQTGVYINDISEKISRGAVGLHISSKKNPSNSN